ncbi:MAG: lamin tail domain-containing protein, partial [Candidatus Pacearchaeota archaeon]
MRKSWIALQGLIILILISFVSASVIINEVELNPNDECNDCTEWIELYSDNEINLSGWEIKDASNNTFSLNFSFQGYYIIDNLSISLNNANEKLFLYNNSRLIFETPLFSDSSNDNKT